MREIRFRAWDKKYKEMMTPEHLWKCTFYICPCNGTFNAYGVDPDEPENRDKEGMGENENLIPMQYTGLKDKNGKEIYEGDIIEFETFGKQRREVYWDNDFACWRIIRGIDVEIIGNIYENPELIPK